MREKDGYCSVSMYVRVCVCARMCTCVPVREYTCTSLLVYECVCVYTRMCVYLCVSVVPQKYGVGANVCGARL